MAAFADVDSENGIQRRAYEKPLTEAAMALATMRGHPLHMNNAGPAILQQRFALCRPAAMPNRRIQRTALRALPGGQRPGFESVEDGAKSSTENEAQAVYEYSTHQGLKMEEIEEDEAEVRQICALRKAFPCLLMIAVHGFFTPSGQPSLGIRHARWTFSASRRLATCIWWAKKETGASATCWGCAQSRTSSTRRSASCGPQQRCSCLGCHCQAAHHARATTQGSSAHEHAPWTCSKIRVTTPLQAMLEDIGIPSSQYPEGNPERAVFCSRTLNLRAIQAIGERLLFRQGPFQLDSTCLIVIPQRVCQL